MQRHEYRVVAAPAQAGRVRGLRTAADRYAHALAEVMNGLGREGWEYVRAESLPCEDRPGLLSRPVTTTVHLLVFRRPLAEAATLPLRPGAEPPAPPPALPAAEPPAEAAPPGAARIRLKPLPERPGAAPRLNGPAERGLFRGPVPRAPDPGPPAPPDGRSE